MTGLLSLRRVMDPRSRLVAVCAEASGVLISKALRESDVVELVPMVTDAPGGGMNGPEGELPSSTIPGMRTPVRVSSVKMLEKLVFCWAKPSGLSTMRRKHLMRGGKKGREFIGQRSMGRDGIAKMLEGGGGSVREWWLEPKP